METTIEVQKGWLKSLLEYVERTQKYLDEELTSDERMTLIKAGVPELCGYASSAESILKYNK